MTTTPTRRRDQLVDAAMMLAPVQPLIVLAVYARTRTAAAWRNEDGLSKTTEVAIWTGIGLLAAIGIGTVLITALRNRAGVIGGDIENTPLP